MPSIPVHFIGLSHLHTQTIEKYASKLLAFECKKEFPDYFAFLFSYFPNIRCIVNKSADSHSPINARLWCNKPFHDFLFISSSLDRLFFLSFLY